MFLSIINTIKGNIDSNDIIAGTYDDIHIVITTGCSGYQNWQAETLLYSWAKLEQPGRITRIISGCNNDNERLKANTTAIPNDNNRILFYFTPDYSPDSSVEGTIKGGRKFWYFNKPYGMHQWFTEMEDSIYESVIVLIDPDMILLNKFLFHVKDEAQKISDKLRITSTENKKVHRDLWVREGHPVSQKYGIGPKWTKWRGFCDDNINCNVTERDAWNYYSVGPPYMMHKNDWKKVLPKWIEFSPLALKFCPQPDILAEMYSFSIACAYWNLPHEYLLSMISGTDSSTWMENWHEINWDGIYYNNNDNNINIFTEKYNLYVLHYCHGYWLGKNRNQGTIRNGGVNFHKGHVPVDLLYDCDIPLLIELNDYSIDNYTLYTNRDHTIDNREFWVLYHLIKFINAAALNYKLKYCHDYIPSWKLVLQQPEIDNQRRMNYLFNQYDNKISWNGA